MNRSVVGRVTSSASTEGRESRVRTIDGSEEMQEGKRPRLILGCFKPDETGVDGEASETEFNFEAYGALSPLNDETPHVGVKKDHAAALQRTKPTGWESLEGMHSESLGAWERLRFEEETDVFDDVRMPRPFDGGSTFANNGSDHESATEDDFLHIFFQQPAGTSSTERSIYEDGTERRVVLPHASACERTSGISRFTR